MGGIWGEGRGKNHNGKGSNMEGGGGYGAKGTFNFWKCCKIDMIEYTRRLIINNTKYNF